jgi:predicted Zn-dependent protease
MKRLLVLAAVIATVSVSSAPQARKSWLYLVSDSQMNQMGAEAFDKLKTSSKLANDPVRLSQSQCVVKALVAEIANVTPNGYRTVANLTWEVQIFEDPNPNAFALPGGKVGINTGMFDVAKTQGQLAAVLGHEIAHVVSKHSNARISDQMLAGATLNVLGAVGGRNSSPEKTKQWMGLLGMGAQVGVLLPNSRKQESEADLLGQSFMTRAGFDPNQAPALWQNMMAASKSGRAPQILSTHPDPENRIKELQARMPELTPFYQDAQRNGKVPKCF